MALAIVFLAAVFVSWRGAPAQQKFLGEERFVTYGSREGTIQKYFANPKKYFKSQYFSQITVEKFDKSDRKSVV